MEASREMNEKGLSFSSDAASELEVYQKAIRDVVDLTFAVFDKEDQKMARKVEPLEAVVNDINAKIKNHHMQSGKCTIELGFILTDILTDFERISDHCSNIAACVCQVYDGELDTHQYLERVKNGDNQEFQQEYQRLKEVYRLPDSAK